MIRDIIKDTAFLSLPSLPATREDAATAADLLDTLAANADRCVGLAANMIGVAKQIVVIDDEGKYRILYNPVILKAKEPYQTEEACLSLEGTRPTKRYRVIKVAYQNERFQPRVQNFEGFSAQILQHEIDHCHGILI